MRERLHHAVVDRRGFVVETFPHGEIGLGGANESLAQHGGMGNVIVVDYGSEYNTPEGRRVHGLSSKGEIPADNITHGRERLT